MSFQNFPVLIKKSMMLNLNRFYLRLGSCSDINDLYCHNDYTMSQGVLMSFPETKSPYFRSCRGCLEKAMAPHSITLAWKIPWMEKPGRLQSVGSLRVGHD